MVNHRNLFCGTTICICLINQKCTHAGCKTKKLPAEDQNFVNVLILKELEQHIYNATYVGKFYLADNVLKCIFLHILTSVLYINVICVIVTLYGEIICCVT
ncbi:hypothetical protein X975_17338, partial [Stegodyphus mimosarum]